VEASEDWVLDVEPEVLVLASVDEVVVEALDAVASVPVLATIAPAVAIDVSAAPPTSTARRRPTRRVLRARSLPRGFSFSVLMAVVFLSSECAQDPADRPCGGPSPPGEASWPSGVDWGNCWSWVWPWVWVWAGVDPDSSSGAALFASALEMVAPIASAVPRAPSAPAATTPRRADVVRRTC